MPKIYGIRKIIMIYEITELRKFITYEISEIRKLILKRKLLTC